MKASLRRSVATLVGSVTLLLAPAAFAQDACLNDTDCPGGGAVCGGDVCNWNKPLPAPLADPNKPYTCNPAGTDAKGMDGWCSDASAAFCKCQAQGAKCSGVWCTFTKPEDAPPATGGGGMAAGGMAAGGMATGGTGTTAPPAEEGGCSVSAPGSTGTGAALSLGLLGLGLAFARRRR
jgi:MYXO-CTERM domain-containing protein